MKISKTLLTAFLILFFSIFMIQYSRAKQWEQKYNNAVDELNFIQSSLNEELDSCLEQSEKQLDSILELRGYRTAFERCLESKKETSYTGTASYYSENGCVGCSKNLTMANGDRLDDSKLTVAFNKAPLNSKVRVCNVYVDKCVVSKVTDTGGFEPLGRIIDLSLATKEAIDCSSLCQVKVILL